jgi:Ca-activated chloride channel homolog
MNNEPRVFGLSCVDGRSPAPVLQGVLAEGRLDGVLFELTLRQTYRNAGDRLLEVVYSFPLPQQAVLLGFASELNGERKAGSIVAKATAERQYEKALGDGDAPVMLEALSGGLHTANIGNLQPGDEIVLEVRFAQLLAFEQGRLRLAIPTTIAPRYGKATQAGLQPQQVPQASLDAEYSIALSVLVAGALAAGTIECPTHASTRAVSEGGVRLTLDTGSWLDRDVVIVITPQEPLPSLVIKAQDTLSKTAPVVLMAALQARPPAQRESVALKVLVDCSDSMAGDSIASARVAVGGILAELGKADQVSLSRFGSQLEHLHAPTACTTEPLRLLGHTVDDIQADLGGTEMAKALKGVFALPMPADAIGSDVLLITDGETWQTEETIAAARASGHRVFVLGVGSSPAEGVLRALADATGGACDFATPGEALEAAARRMLSRVRQVPWRDARIDWGGEPVWQTALPVSVFGGDTVVAFAGMTNSPAAGAVRMRAPDAHGVATEVGRGEADAPASGDSLPRMAALRRKMAARAPEALDLALLYQLLCEETSCVLVHERAEADKATHEAELHCVSPMLAAGWGATGSVIRAACHLSERPSYFDYAPFEAPTRNGRMADEGFVAPVFGAELPPEVKSLADVSLAILVYLTKRGNVVGLAAHCASFQLESAVRDALSEASALAGGEGEALLILAHWASSHINAKLFHVAARLPRYLDVLKPGTIETCIELFERRLGLEIRRSLAKKNPDVYLPDVAKTLNKLGNLSSNENRKAEARQQYEEALEIRRSLAKKNPDVYLSEVAATLNNLGALSSGENRKAEARKQYEEALEIGRSMAKKNPDVYLPYVASMLNNLGVLDRDENRNAEARQLYEEALEIRRLLAKKNPDVYLPYVANTLNSLGVLDRDENRNAEARQQYEEALEIRRSLAKKNPDVYLPHVATTLNNLGVLSSDENRKAEARKQYEESSAIFRRFAAREPATYETRLRQVEDHLRALSK